MRCNGRDAPIPDLPRLTSERRVRPRSGQSLSRSHTEVKRPAGPTIAAKKREWSGRRRRLRERWIWLPIWIEVDEKMNSDTLVTAAAFEAFLHCETKAYLLHEGTHSQSKFGV
jgi:hypothetical protein